MAKQVVCNSTCTTRDKDGLIIRLRERTVWDADHPFVKFRPEFFDGAEIVSRPVEAATAVPGEKRKAARPKKAAAAAPAPAAESNDE